jgi:ERF superfamily
VSTPLPVLLVQVKEAVGAIGKGERNAQQGFNFRGIDAVINAVAPALIDAGIVVLPDVRTYEYGTVEVGQRRTPMGHARVVVEYTFVGPEGDTLTCSAPGEAMDSGDKATAKAMSVAYRTALLQALSLPTTEMDPDAVVYQRTDAAALSMAVARVQSTWATSHGGELDMAALATHFASAHEGMDIRSADADTLNRYAESLGSPAAPVPPSVQDHLTRATTPADAEAQS